MQAGVDYYQGAVFAWAKQREPRVSIPPLHAERHVGGVVSFVQRMCNNSEADQFRDDDDGQEGNGDPAHAATAGGTASGAGVKGHVVGVQGTGGGDGVAGEDDNDDDYGGGGAGVGDDVDANVGDDDNDDVNDDHDENNDVDDDDSGTKTACDKSFQAALRVALFYVLAEIVECGVEVMNAATRAGPLCPAPTAWGTN